MTTTMTTDAALDALEAASIALPTTHDYGKPPPGICALDQPPSRAIDKRRLAGHRLLARERGQPGVTVHPHHRLAAYSAVKLILPPGRVFTKATRRRLLAILQAAGGWWGCLASCGARQASGVCPHADAVHLAAQLHDIAVDEMVGEADVATAPPNTIPCRRCGVCHRSWYARARCQFRPILWVSGNPPITGRCFASVSRCRAEDGYTVELYATRAEAERAKAMIDRTGCGGGCWLASGHAVVEMRA